MITRQTITLLILTMGVFLYLAAFEWDRKPPPPPSLPSLPTVDIAQVKSVELQRGPQFFRLERGTDGWDIVQPFKYPAQESRVMALVEALAALRPNNHIPDNESGSDLAKFGLDPERMTLRLEGLATNHVFRLGKLTPLRDKLYLAASESPGIYVVPIHFLQTLPREMDHWRDPRLAPLGVSRARVDHLTLTDPAGPVLELRRNTTNGTWRITQPEPSKRADPLRIRQFLEELQGWTAKQFISAESASSKEDMGLQPPVLKLRLGHGTNRVVALDLGGTHTNQTGFIYAHNPILDTLMTVSRTNTLDLLKQSPWKLFGDRQMINSFKSNAVARIDIHTPREKFSLAQNPTDNTWQIVKPTVQNADEELVGDLLFQLANLQAQSLVKDVVTDFGEYGLEEPSTSVVLWQLPTNGSVTNKMMARVDFGRVDPDNGLIFARRHDENMVYALDGLELQTLPDQHFRLRNKQPWQFADTEVSKVILTLKGDEPVEFSRNDLRRWSGPSGQLTTPSETTMNKTLNALGKFSVERWLVQGDDKFSVPTFGFLDTAERIELEVKQSGRLVRHKLHLGAANLQGERYAATTGPDGQMVVFTFPEVVYAQVLKIYALLPD
ncbi:MAG: hypothetical protein CMO66_05770 [Verrucomicrobiales bacterium]|nr:hypothetical protein [Verrucomicrobiales bacterium]